MGNGLPEAVQRCRAWRAGEPGRDPEELWRNTRRGVCVWRGVVVLHVSPNQGGNGEPLMVQYPGHSLLSSSQPPCVVARVLLPFRVELKGLRCVITSARRWERSSGHSTIPSSSFKVGTEWGKKRAAIETTRNLAMAFDTMAWVQRLHRHKLRHRIPPPL